jgi:hypothetical protein
VGAGAGLFARWTGFAGPALAGEGVAGGIALAAYVAALFLLEGRALMTELRYLRRASADVRP